MNLRSLLLLSVLFFGLCVSPGAFAEEPERGRLPDGRAFRTDAEGNEVIDYIAELEVTNQALQRTVYGLEQQVEENLALIEELEKNSEATALKERTLSEAKKEESRSPVEKKINPELVCKDFCAPSESQDEELALLSQKLEDAKIDAQIARKRSTAESAELNSKIRILEDQLAARNKEIDSLKGELSRASDAREIAEDKLARVPAKIVTTTRAAETPRASLARAQEKAVEVLRKSLLKDIHALESMVDERNDLFKRYNASATSVKLHPQSAISKKNLSLSKIEDLLEDAKDVATIKKLSGEILSIQRLVKEDLQTVQRMQKLN